MNKKDLNIVVVGKDVSQADAYLSVDNALQLAANFSHIDLNVVYIDSHLVNANNVKDLLSYADGILVPGGFNYDGVEGMILAINYARTNDISFFGICLGMQLTVIEYARNVAGLAYATSSEFAIEAEYKVIDRIPLLNNGVLREGVFFCKIKEGSLLNKCYQSLNVQEAFRHGYNFNNKYRTLLENKGLNISASSNDDIYVEAVELTNHKFFVGVQFHPEQTNVEKPHPLFLGFIEAAFKNRKQ